MDDVELWDLASRAAEPLREEVLARLAADPAQVNRVRELLAQPAPREAEGARYEILGLVGAGTQADVYQARRLDLDRACALKVFRSVSDPSFVERVRAEAGLMARVLSPHVVTVFDAGDLGDGRYFIEMALCAEPDVAGAPGAVALARSLRAWVTERGPLPPDEAARLLQPICAALAAAHRAGVVHADVKPENVLVLPVSRRAMLADFGIATSLGARPGGAAGGTIPYLPPERLQGAPADAAADVYGLGGTLLFALCGRPPHPDRRADGEDPRGGEPWPVPAGVPRSLAEIVERALARDPARRPGADELAAALDAFLARRPTTWELRRPGRRFSLFCQRHRTLLTLALFGGVVAGTLGLGLLRTVVAKTGLQAQARALDARVAALDADVERLTTQRAELEAALGRLRDDREAIAGAEARQHDARLQAEGRAAAAEALAGQAAAQAREVAGRAERAEASAAQLEARLAEAQAAARAAEAERDAQAAELHEEAAQNRAAVEALRASWTAEVTAVRADLRAEREAAAGAQQRLAALEKEHGAAERAHVAAEARLQGRLDACVAERDELRRPARATAPPGGTPPPNAAPPPRPAAAPAAATPAPPGGGAAPSATRTP